MSHLLNEEIGFEFGGVILVTLKMAQPHYDLSDGLSPLQCAELELERTRQEKDALAAQYSDLLGRLTTMRSSLGNKLKQDAVGSDFDSPHCVCSSLASLH